jgi:PKD repeat protein
VADSLGGELHFPNACFAACAGFGPDDFIECSTTIDCNCDLEFDPVCVADSLGNELQFPNACFAACAGFGPDNFIECSTTIDCNCDLEFAPVCVADSLGNELHFPNACFAECAGFGPDDFIECDSTGSGCDNCPAIYAPVCAIAETGDTLTFANACIAICQGYTPDQFFDCSQPTEGDCDNCDCPDGVYQPVCVYTAVGPIIFPNTCVALCHGYTEADLTNCFGPEECRVDFFMEFLNENGLEIQFTGLLGGDYPNASWFWEFGDGATSTDPAPVHTYAEPGFYTVVLNVTADSACQATIVYTIVVGDGGVVTSDCQAMFFFEQDPANLATFQFSDMSLGDVATYYWNFGDGASSQEANPVHTYAQPGIYFVTLTIITADDCISSATMLLHYGDDIYYDNTCSALFLPLINSNNLSVMCLNLSSEDAVSFNWDFGDGSTSTDFMPMHQYAEAGTYTITLAITTADGCTNTISATINLATGGFTASPRFSIINSNDEAAPETHPVGLFPNPASETAWLSFRLNAGEAYTVDVLGLDGRRISRLSGRATGAPENLPIELGGLPGGLYLVRLAGPDGAQTLKLVKE